MRAIMWNQTKDRQAALAAWTKEAEKNSQAALAALAEAKWRGTEANTTMVVQEAAEVGRDLPRGCAVTTRE